MLLHDGGGNRAQTVAALPGMIRELRARGYQIVPVATLLGKTYDDVMPPIAPNERFWARVDATGFWLLSTVNSFIVLVFFVGDLLMSGRLVSVGALAIYDRFRRRGTDGPDMSGYRPAGRGSDSRLQRREGDRANGNGRLELGLPQPASDRHR